MFNYQMSFVFGCSSDSLVVMMLPALLEPVGQCKLLGFTPLALLMWMLFLRPADMQEHFIGAENQESSNFFLDSFDSWIHVSSGPWAEWQRRRKWKTIVGSNGCLTYILNLKNYIIWLVNSDFLFALYESACLVEFLGQRSNIKVGTEVQEYSVFHL